MNGNRDNWGSKIGVILAVAGSAVGLGNFLRFPVQAASNGGGSFIIPYIIAFIVLGIPLSWMEWTLGRYAGHKGHGTAPFAYHNIIQKPFAKYIGSLGLLPPLFITFYYMFIESWILAFAWFSLTGKLTEVVNAGLITEFFTNYIMLNEKVGPVPSAVLFFLITFAINVSLLSLGVRKGIERVNKVAMPVLLIMGILLVFRVLTIPGIERGLAYMWNPDFSALLNPSVWLAAAGQVFFTMSLGMGIVFCYASYLKPKEDIALSALTAGSTNGFAEVILGGTIVIPLAVLIAGSNIEECAKLGTFGLAFQSMPHVFAKIPFGETFQTIWFCMLFFAGVTSAISIIQPLISFCEDDLKFSRKRSVSIVSFITFIGGLIGIFGLAAGAVDELDFWGGSFLLVVLATIEAFIFAFILGRKKIDKNKKASLMNDEAIALLLEGSSIKIPKVFLWTMKYICPFALLVLLGTWGVSNGLEVLLLKNVPANEMTSFLGFAMPKVYFIWGLRIFLILLMLLVNLAIWYATKKNTNLVGRDTHIRQVDVGNS